MDKTIRSSIRTGAAAAVCGAVLAASTLAAPSQAADSATDRSARRAAATTLSDFAYRGDVYGVKLVTNSVEAFNVKDAHAQQLCTRGVGHVVDRSSMLTLPDNPLIDISLSNSSTETYQDGSTHGIRGINTIGDVSIGGTVGPLVTPKLVIKGLRTTADAFHTPQGFGHKESFTFASISLDLLDNTIVQNLPPELQDLLAPLQQVTDTVFQGTGQVAQQVFDVLADVTKPIEIPGLGTIALGYKKGKVNRHSARSQASALRINVTAGDTRQLVELGTARVRVGGPAPAGVFRAGGSAMDYQALRGALRFGNVQHKALACEGNGGKVQTFTVPSATQLLPVPVVLNDVVYQNKGKQKRRKDVAFGWSRTGIGHVSIPLAQLEISGISSQARMRRRDGGRMKSRVITSIDSITAGGQPLAVPAPGGTVDLPNGAGTIQRQLVARNRNGSKVIALRIKLFEEAVVIDLARTSGHIYRK